jgi:hypothetical protein
VPTVNVASAGAPASATNFAVYAGLYPDNLALQQATRTTTALGSTYTLVYPLTNSIGANRAASNVNSNILGIAMHDSAAEWAQGIGGALTAGTLTSRLGSWGNPAPLSDLTPIQALIAKLSSGTPIEISLKQAWSGALIGSTAGLTLDTTQQAAGVFIADTTATTCLTIDGIAGGAEVDDGGGVGDTGSRIIARITTGTI